MLLVVFLENSHKLHLVLSTKQNFNFPSFYSPTRPSCRFIPFQVAADNPILHIFLSFFTFSIPNVCMLKHNFMYVTFLRIFTFLSLLSLLYFFFFCFLCNVEDISVCFCKSFGIRVSKNSVVVFSHKLKKENEKILLSCTIHMVKCLM